MKWEEVVELMHYRDARYDCRIQVGNWHGRNKYSLRVSVRVTVQLSFLLPDKCIVELRLASDVFTNLGAWIPVHVPYSSSSLYLDVSSEVFTF
jgi:hypothetical protein